MKTTKKQISPESQIEAMKIAKSTQKPGQNKDQTKLIAQGIEKGIALYKKQQKEKNRQADRARKKSHKEKQMMNNNLSIPEKSGLDAVALKKNHTMLPWGLLLVSWILMFIYLSLS